jgi:hypothetical protein
VSYRNSPFAVLGKVTRNGDLVGKNAIDMRLRTWGELEAVSQGSQGYWRFRCIVCAHEFLYKSGVVRRRDRDGRPNHCPLRSAHATTDARTV